MSEGQEQEAEIRRLRRLTQMRGKRKFRDKLFELAICDFERNLRRFRKLYPVKTICMHGIPLSKWDNRDLWKRYDYRDYGIIAESYFDVDFDEVFYITDTGRRWDGSDVSVRDKVLKKEDEKIKEQKVQIPVDDWMNRMIPAGLDEKNKRDALGGMNRMDPAGLDDSLCEGWVPSESGTNRMAGWERIGFKDLRFRSTFDIIEAAERGLLPDRIMINTHPQRWTDNHLPWVKELVWQNMKNLGRGNGVKSAFDP